MNVPSHDRNRQEGVYLPRRWLLALFMLAAMVIAAIFAIVNMPSGNTGKPQTDPAPYDGARPDMPLGIVSGGEHRDQMPDDSPAVPAGAGVHPTVPQGGKGPDRSTDPPISTPERAPRVAANADADPPSKPDDMVAHDDPAASPSSHPSTSTDAAYGTASAPPGGGDDHPEAYPGNYGRNEPVAADATPQAASVAEALKGKNHPERLSPLIQPKPFNADECLKDPKVYCDIVEPGRVFQGREPAEGVNRIQAVTPLVHQIRQGQRVALSVQAEPGYPVSVTSF